ncbi:MAG: helix-turn-helix domain-containing protein [Thermodesulfobacteriota bacterium]
MKQYRSADDDLLKRTLADFERHIIVSALEQARGNQTEAARRLGTTKRILTYRMRKHGIDPRLFHKTRRDNRGWQQE